MAYLSPDKKEELAAKFEVDTDRIEEWYAAFGVFDKDHDGKVTATELNRVLRDLRQDPTEKELEEMIAEVDENKTGTVEFPEFCSLMKRKYKSPQETENQLVEAFKVFDKDGNNFISADELTNVMKSIGEPLSADEVQEMMSAADIDGDGKINYNEFARMMMA